MALLLKDSNSIRRFAFEGIPEDMPLLRSLVWKINLRYLPKNYEAWDNFVTKKREEYNDIKSSFIKKLNIEVEYRLLESEEAGYLNLTDRKLLEEIDKDIRRTHSNMHFFYMPSKNKDKIENQEIEEMIELKKNMDSVRSVLQIYRKDASKWETNSDVLTRVLFIFAKLNDDIGYVQGMNEILAPIYYCFFPEQENPSNVEHGDQLEFEADIEADSFWAFSQLMEDIKPVFTKSKDSKSDGIFNRLAVLSDFLKIVDKDLHCHLARIKLDFDLFAFKWVILLFTQEFMLPEVLRIWDAVLSDQNRYKVIYVIALSILVAKRAALLCQDFSGCLKEMKNLIDIDCEELIAKAGEIWRKNEKKFKKKLERLK